MRARRFTAIELDNGDLQVSIVIEAKDRDAFFAMSPLPRTDIVLSAPEVKAVIVTAQKPPAQVAGAKPATQTVAPSGAAPGTVSGALAKDAGEAGALCDNPWFQQYVVEQTKPQGEYDSLRLAQLYMKEQCLWGALWDSDASVRYRELVTRYTAWCASKGYR